MGFRTTTFVFFYRACGACFVRKEDMVWNILLIRLTGDHPYILLLVFCLLYLFLDYPYLIKLTQIKSSQRWFQCICYQSNYQIVTGSVVVHSPINILVNTLVGAQLRKKNKKQKKLY